MTIRDTPVQCFIWMIPQMNIDWNQTDMPYQLQMMTLAFGVAEDGYGMTDTGENNLPQYQSTYLNCNADETADSLRAKATAWARDAFGIPLLPCTFILDGEASA